MIDAELSFETNSEDSFVDMLEKGSTVSALRLLMQFGETEGDRLEEILFQLGEKEVTLDLSDLPKPKTPGDGAMRLKMEQKLAKEGLSSEKLDENDPLRLYLEELAAIPADNSASDIERSLSRVVEIAREFTGKGVLLLDLIQEGSMGLMQAAEIYGGTDTFIEQRDRLIRFYMAKETVLQAQALGVGERLRQATEDYRTTDERLLAELGRNPTVEEIAEAMHISPEEASNVAKVLEDLRVLSRAKQTEKEDLPQEEEQAVEDTAYFQMRQRIADLMSGLEEKDATLLQLRYGLEGGLPMTPQQVAARLGMTPDEVVAREGEILMKLRQQKED